MFGAAFQDVYLYYFLLRYPGKSLVFLSSIDGIRRLMPLVELLNINAFPLHSQLEQRQRLKNLDRCVFYFHRFKSSFHRLLEDSCMRQTPYSSPPILQLVVSILPPSITLFTFRYLDQPIPTFTEMEEQLVPCKRGSACSCQLQMREGL